MGETNDGFKWTALIWATFLICVVPWVIKLILANAYALYVGIQTRGETEIIGARLDALLSSAGFLFITIGFLALVAIWQGYTTAKKAPAQAVATVAVAVVVALTIQTALGIGPGQDALGVAMSWVAAIAGAAAGVFTARRGAAPMTVQSPNS